MNVTIKAKLPFHGALEGGGDGGAEGGMRERVGR